MRLMRNTLVADMGSHIANVECSPMDFRMVCSAYMVAAGMAFPRS